MLRIDYIPNRFKEDCRIYKTFKFENGKTVAYYVKKSEYPYNPINDDVIISGKVIDDLSVIVRDKDQIIVTPKIEAPVIAFLAFGTTQVSIINMGAALMMAARNVLTVVALASMGYSVYSAFNKPKVPSFGTIGTGLDEGSPTYGWDGIATQRNVGVPVPIIYGEHKVGGNVINEYVWTDGNKHYLNTLLSLCEGEIEEIGSIKINDNPVANFDGVSQTTRTGTNTQTVISNFEDLHNIVSIGVELTKDNAYTYTTTDDDVEAFELKLQLPSGLYQQSADTGEITAWSVTYKVEYKLTSSGSWTDLGSTTISDETRSVLRRVYRKDGLTSGRYDIRVTRTSENSTLTPNKTGDLYLSSIDEIKTDDLIYPNTALLGLKLLATEQLSGASPNITCVVKGKKVSAPQVMNGASQVDWEDYYWNQTENEFRLLSNDTSLTWDGTTYVSQYCANPIWCLKDLLTDTRYGLGDFIDSSLLDTTILVEMAKYCDERVDDGSGVYEKRFRLDVVIDSFTKSLDLIAQLASTFNAFAFYSSGVVKFNIDKETTPSQVFGMGNIIADSFNQSWKSLKDTPNIIEVSFLDKDKDYEQETISIIDETSLTNGEPRRTHSIKLYTTRMSQALRVGRYALKVAQNVNRTVSFRAAIDAIACQVGDVIDISHDVPQWGFSGRVVSGTTGSVTLDQSVTISSGPTYKIEVRFSDGTIEEKTVADGAGTYTTLTVTENFSQSPTAFDVYAFGETDIQTKPFRVISLARDNKDEIEITATEYLSDVYDDSAVTVPTNNYSALTRTVPDVENLAVVEKNVILDDGTVGSVISVYYEIPDMTSYILNPLKKVKIYLSSDSGESWKNVGDTTKNAFTINETLVQGSTYTVAVVSVGWSDSEASISTSPQDSITIQGKTLPPSNVTGFDVSQAGDQLRFTWNPITDADLARYIIKKGSEWTTGDIIAELIDTTTFSYPVGELGQQMYMIKAVDTSGNESSSYASDTLTVTPPPEMNFEINYDLFSRNLEYLRSDLSIENDNSYNRMYVRPVLSLDTSTTWEELEATANGWEYNEENGLLVLDGTSVSSGYWEMTESDYLDLETMFEFKVVPDIDYSNVSGGSVVMQISYSTDNVTWTSFENVSIAETYIGRYIRLRLNVSTTDASHHIKIYSCRISIQAPSVIVAWGRDVDVSNSAGITISYGREFSFAPRIIANIVNGIEGIVIIDNKTTTTFDVQCKNLSGSGIGTAVIDWEAKGY